jgi:hypothetical protein
MALELFGRLAILADVRRFLRMGAANSRSMSSDKYVHMKKFVRRSIDVPFRWFLGDARLRAGVNALPFRF